MSKFHFLTFLTGLKICPSLPNRAGDLFLAMRSPNFLSADGNFPLLFVLADPGDGAARTPGYVDQKGAPFPALLTLSIHLCFLIGPKIFPAWGVSQAIVVKRADSGFYRKNQKQNMMRPRHPGLSI
jgi:hypothetical protein